MLLLEEWKYEKGKCVMKYKLREPRYQKDDLVSFIFNTGKKEYSCQGVICGADIYRVSGEIVDIEYDIWGKDHENPKEECLYKHINEKYILGVVGKNNQ